MGTRTASLIVRGAGVLALALGASACNTTYVAPTPDLGPPPPPVVAAVPHVVIRDPETQDEIKITKGYGGTEVRNVNRETGSSYVVSGDLRSRDQVEMYSDNTKSGQQVSVRPGRSGVVVEGVDKKADRYWEVVDPEGRDGPNFVATSPSDTDLLGTLLGQRGNTYSITTEPDGHGDKSRQNDIVTPGDVDVKSRIDRARSGRPAAKKR